MLEAIGGALAKFGDSLNWVNGLIAAVTAFAGALFGWWKFVHGRHESRKQVAKLLDSGDRFSETAAIEGEGHKEAIEQYRKALELDPENVDIYRRILAATRRKLELEADRPARTANEAFQKEVAAALTGLYEFQACSDALKNDQGLLLEEVDFLCLGGKRDSALAALRRARELYPEEPEVLARLGGLTGDAELIRRAIAARESEAWYHAWLADVLVKRGELGTAMREYRRTAELAKGRDIATARQRNAALRDILDTFKKQAYRDGGSILGPSLEMPLEERAGMLEYFQASYRTSDPAPHFFLASLYHALGQLEKAHRHIRQAVGDDRSGWKSQSRKPMLELFATILEEGKYDASTLAEVQAMLK